MSSRRFIAVSDSHGTLLDPRCEEAVLEFIKDFRPTVRCHLGDGWDLAALRRGASPEEQAISLNDDFDAAESFLTKFFKGGTENHYLNGNHDRPRLENILGSSNALIREAAEDGIREMDRILRRCRARVLPYDARLGVLRIGHLTMLHGYACGITGVQKAARVYGSCLLGHLHVVESVPVESINGPSEARCIGALCTIDQPYNARQTNKLRHSQGWAYGYLHDDGTYTLFQARRIGDTFHAAKEIKSY